MTLGSLISKAWLNTTESQELSSRKVASSVTLPPLVESSNFPSVALSQHDSVLCVYICA